MAVSILTLPSIPSAAFRRPSLRFVVIASVALLHGWLLLEATRLAPRTLPDMAQPQALLVRWVNAPSPTPRPPVPTPVKMEEPAKPIPPTPTKPAPIHRLTAKALPAPEPAPPSASAPPAIAPTAASLPASTPAAADAAQGETAPPLVIPPSPAAYLSNPAPIYPDDALRHHQQGQVMLRVLVSATGTPRQVSIDQSCGTPSLDDAAAAAVRGWRFVPGQKGGQAVEAWVLVPIIFKLRS